MRPETFLALSCSIFAFCGCKTGPKPAPPAEAASSLATFDYVWRTISETHYDTNYGGVDWKAIREEYRPRAAQARSDRETRMILQSMLDRLGMSHTVVLPAAQTGETSAGKVPASANKTAISTEEQGGEPGFEFREIDSQFLVTRVEAGSPASNAGVMPGWAIESIDGFHTSNSHDTTAPGGRHQAFERWSQALRRLNGPPGTSVRVEFTNGQEETIALDIQREKKKGMPVKLGHLPVFYSRMRHSKIQTADGGPVIGCLQFNVWMLPLAQQLDQAIDELRACDGIILDLRGNVGGVAAMTIGFSGHFLDKPLLLGVMKTRDAELTLTANPRFADANGNPATPFTKPLAILVDALSASTSEMFAGAMQSLGRARIFGESTMGEVLPAVTDKLPNGDVFIHAFGDFHTAKGDRLEGRGVIPDTPVKITRAGLLAGRDETIEAAADWIAHQNQNK